MERFAQYRTMGEYSEALQWPARRWARDNPQPIYNAHLGMRVMVMHQLGELDRQYVDFLPWGYRPGWAAGRANMPIVINAYSLTVPTRRYYSKLWEYGRRCLVPLDGWFEWVKGAPHYIYRADGAPLFAAALTSVDPADLYRPAGVVILTRDDEGGVLDPADRRPLILEPVDAKRWIDRYAESRNCREALSLSLQADLLYHRAPDHVRDISSNGPELIRPRRDLCAAKG
ncbi:SOS response-associated peptidase family protein [Chitiniphilus purpureus]|uniref:Abasic site processing protein n=1 Tax=Chitiniphilus purpureus TaxID=2981137 RepID=A0ABY6DHQ1_9NEIS|nr:SOS response-associated peptidase family protein [Chitiniphilus sp. CD1]UXY13880.1 SOS response-associated peptidase family protein [Chitiniphilus sp. CD1]